MKIPGISRSETLPILGKLLRTILYGSGEAARMILRRNLVVAPPSIRRASFFLAFLDVSRSGVLDILRMTAGCARGTLGSCLLRLGA
jgi:hypothetical protein